MARGALLVTLALAGAAGGARADGHGDARAAAARLRHAQSRYEAHLMLARPDLASVAGDMRADDRLEPVTEATLDRDAAELGSFAAELAAIDTAALAPRDRDALEALRAASQREAAALASGFWRRDPNAYMVLAHDAPMASATRPHVNVCERARRATARLRVVPEVLRSAEVNLRTARGFDPDSAAARWRAAMMDLRLELPRLFDACHDAERYADFVEADTLALGAMARFTRFLAGKPGATGGAPAAH